MPEEDPKKGKLAESFPEASVFEGQPHFFYEVKEPKLLDAEKKIADSLKKVILKELSLNEFAVEAKKFAPKQFVIDFDEKILKTINVSNALLTLPDAETLSALQIALLAIIKQHLPLIKNEKAFVGYVLDETVGYGLFSPLMRDPNLEEVMVNGWKKPIFVFHKRYGMCKTNLSVFEEGFFLNFLSKIASTVNKKVNERFPLLDARLPDGSRANATAQYVTPFGPSLTIRKFNRVPLSMIDLIANNTISSEVAAFLWAMVEGFNIEPMNVIITGGAGTGKTTTLNSLAYFVRQNDRVISIEDTPELQLGSRLNWIQMEARPPMREIEEVTMDDLLKNALRMRPDRLIVGEVRGKEAQTMFTAMDTGQRGCMGTLHSNSGREMLLRLRAPPMNVPEIMLPLLDLALIQIKMYSKEKGIIRRVSQVLEISRMEDKTLLAELFLWHRERDKIEKTDIPSHALEVLAERTSRTKKEVMREMKIREKILEWMLEKGIRSSPEVEEIIQKYYMEPESILEKVSNEL